MTTKMSFTPEFVKSLSPADRSVYIMYYKKELEEEEKKRNKQPGMIAPMSAAPKTME